MQHTDSSAPNTAMAPSREPAVTADPPREYFGWFDPLRAVLAFVVFLSHADMIPDAWGGRVMGGYAVEVFFALSGFLVGGILIKQALKSDAGGPAYWNQLPRFYCNRCLRIWVPYYILLLLFAGLITARQQWTGESLGRMPYALTYTYNTSVWFFGVDPVMRSINHIWTLAVEEQFYLICPLLIGVCRKRWLIGLAVPGVAILTQATTGVADFTAMGFGVAAAALYHSVGRTPWSRLAAVAGPLGVLGLGLGLHLDMPRGNWITSFSAMLIVVGLSWVRPARPLSHLLGAMSYSFYLFHTLGLYVANPIAKRVPETVHLPVYFLTALTLSTLMSYASVRLIERPLIQNRDRLVKRHPWFAATATWAAWSSMIFGLAYLLYQLSTRGSG